MACAPFSVGHRKGVMHQLALGPCPFPFFVSLEVVVGLKEWKVESFHDAFDNSKLPLDCFLSILHCFPF